MDDDQLLPAGLELIDGGHVGHRATSRQIGKNHLLMRRGKHVGAFRHEVHAAEHDELGFGMFGDLAGQAEGIAGVVGKLDHFVALIVMAENNQRGCRAPLSPRAMRRSSSSSGRPRYRSGSG